MDISISNDLEKSIKNLIEQGKFNTPEQVIKKSIEIGIKKLQQQESTDNNEICQKISKNQSLRLIGKNPFAQGKS